MIDRKQLSKHDKLGSFYLGSRFDSGSGEPTAEAFLYDSKDLTTHAVCVGMTGSGKTGLCITLLEEAALDGIPALVIDPKGDLANLALAFPKLRPEDFEPWIDPGEAQRAGRTVPAQAAATAKLWREGLAEWGQDGKRIAEFQNSAELTLYTPGSQAGRPLNVLRSFSAPGPELAADTEALAERIEGAVSGLLAMLGISPDPLRSREHILLSNLLRHAWQQGESPDLAALIRGIQSPPFDRVGVFELEAFYPSDERMGLAMQLNNLLASPGFENWLAGDPLEIGSLLYGEGGKPRLSVLSIAHLSEAERMFFVTVLLNEVVAWIRAQPGTQSLRALLYMDEVFGYFPPTANPPSKRPMLTLLKQARAYGLGVVLSTQNPVDLDYKGLSNTGTWFLGRLQTERDKARVLDGLEGASIASGQTFDRSAIEAQLSGLGKRVFLVSNAHEDAPELIHTRWALSYLRGPLTREQLKRLVKPSDRQDATGQRQKPATPTPAPRPKGATEHTRPVLPSEIQQRFLIPEQPIAAGERLVYRPALLGRVALHYAQAREDVDHWRKVSVFARLGDHETGSPWNSASLLLADPGLDAEPGAEGEYESPPAAAIRARSYGRFGKQLGAFCYRALPLKLWRSARPKSHSAVGESEEAFLGRLQAKRRELRDLAMEKLRKRFAPKLARLEERIRKAEARIEREEGQYKQQKLQTIVSLGATVLGALFGRKLGSVGNVGRAASTARTAGRAARERSDIERAHGDLEASREKLAALEADLSDELDGLRGDFESEEPEYRETTLRPRKSDTSVEALWLVWEPWGVGATRAAGLSSQARPLARLELASPELES